MAWEWIQFGSERERASASALSVKRILSLMVEHLKVLISQVGSEKKLFLIVLALLLSSKRLRSLPGAGQVINSLH